MRQTKNKGKKINRKRLFDRRRYKHIGWYICDDPELELVLGTTRGVKDMLANCALMPFVKVDEKRGAFLFAQSYGLSEKYQDMVIRTFNRYETGFAENEEYYAFLPSENILKEIDDAIDTEWQELLERIQEQSLRDKG